jgi:hypothetical protein
MSFSWLLIGFTFKNWLVMLFRNPYQHRWEAIQEEIDSKEEVRKEGKIYSPTFWKWDTRNRVVGQKPLPAFQVRGKMDEFPTQTRQNPVRIISRYRKSLFTFPQPAGDI